MARRWVRIALVNLILAALLGLVLRYAYVVELSWMKYNNVLHAHSHMAMLGWGYLAAFALLFYAYRDALESIRATVNRLFIFMECTALGLYLCFPIYGYGIPTVSFLTAHMFLSYYFVFLLWTRLPAHKNYADIRWVKAALFFLVLSTVGVWIIAPIYVMGLSKSIWYYLAVQFFLHFEINAWFWFVAIALFFIHLRQSGIKLERSTLQIVFYLFFISSILTYALSVAWSRSTWLVTTINTAGVLLQAIGAGVLLHMLWPKRRKIMDVHPSMSGRLLILVASCFVIKIVIQLSLIIPALMEVAYTIRNFIVGFIHLILLGIFTPYIFSYLQAEKLVQFKRPATFGLVLFVIGFISTELIIFTQGGMFWMAWGFMPFYYIGLTIATALLPLGLILILFGLIRNSSALNRI